MWNACLYKYKYFSKSLNLILLLLFELSSHKFSFVAYNIFCFNYLQYQSYSTLPFIVACIYLYDPRDSLNNSSVKMKYGNQMVMIRSECRQVKWCKRQIVLVFLFVYEFEMMMRNLQKHTSMIHLFSALIQNVQHRSHLQCD